MVETIELNIKNKVNLWTINDVHFGAKAFREDIFNETINQIKKDNNAIVILNGDLVDAIHSRDFRFDTESVSPEHDTVTKQYIGIKRLLEPIKSKIIAIGDGNHERFIKKISGMDITRLLSEEFGIPNYIDALILKIKISDKTYRCLILHGCNGATSLPGNVTAIKKYAENMETAPDVIIMGHTHRLDLIHNPKLDDKFNTKIKYMAINGSFFDTYKLGENNYATNRFYSPNILGSIVFTFDKDEITFRYNYGNRNNKSKF